MGGFLIRRGQGRADRKIDDKNMRRGRAVRSSIENPKQFGRLAENAPAGLVPVERRILH
jgi:hypothetical protein